MLLFIANIVEQLDLAVEHLEKGDANNARFALMLSDNAIELMLHRIAQDRRRKLKSYQHLEKTYAHEAALDRAQGRHFDEKVKFARLEANLSEDQADTLMIAHAFRNEVHHVGVQHEAILRALAAFHIKTVCDFLATYSPAFMFWGSNQRLPDRAKAYFSDPGILKPGVEDEFHAACRALALKTGHSDKALAETLASHMAQTVEEKDTYIDYISTGAPRPQTRDEVVIDCQVWPLVFSEEGKRFAQKNKFPGGNMLVFLEWLAKNYPLRFKGDPIPAWKKRADKLFQERNSAKALKRYRTFMDETADLRDQIDETTSQVDNYIDEQIDRAKEARYFKE
jgi:hypothetical protein